MPRSQADADRPGAAPPATAAPSAREAACRRLAADARRFPDLLPGQPDITGLSERDASLAIAVHEAAVRQWPALGYLIERATDRAFSTLDAPVRGAMLAGAAQLLLLDRVPAHAALHETVECAKRGCAPGAHRLVNAGLRRLAELRGDEPARAVWYDRADELPRGDGGATPLAHPVWPADPARRLALVTGVAPGLVASWADAFGVDAARAMALNALVRPPTLLNIEHARAPLPPGVSMPHEEAGTAIYTGPRAELASLIERCPGVWVQDPGSAASVRLAAQALADGPPPELIIDLCAGQGTKTRQLLAHFPGATVVAAEVDDARLQTLRTVFSGEPRVDVRHADEAASAFAGRAGLVVLDVPCSNTGVLARRPQARHRFGASQTARLVQTQREIITAGGSMLAPSGAVLYATCSVQHEENAAQTAWAAEELGLRVAAESLRLPRGEPGGPAGRHADGAYACVLRP